MSQATAASRPARGTRPRNRRELIVAAAAELFHRHGYSSVGLADVAEAVGISRPALYRHFSGKQELLAAVVRQAIETTLDTLAAADDDRPDELLPLLARTALDNRAGAVLWQRDGRHLPPEARAELRVMAREIGTRIERLVAARRPRLGGPARALLTWCALGVATSVAFHRTDLPRPEYEDVLADLLEAVLSADLPRLRTAPVVARPPVLASRSRWETILSTAITLFAQHGYASVGMDDIAEAVGIAGPSVYNHFAGKADILTAAVVRGFEWLRRDTSRALAAATDHADGLRRMLHAYVGFALEQHDLLDLLITDAREVPDAQRAYALRAQRDYVDDYVYLMRAVHTDLDPAAARIRALAALGLINDVARTPHLRAMTAASAALRSVGAAVLGISP